MSVPKTQLTVKLELFVSASSRYCLGAALDDNSLVTKYVSNKVKKWTDEVLHLSDIAKIHPNSAYAAFIHGMIHKWNYVMRTINSVGPLFQPLEDAIHQHLIPSLTGCAPCSQLERQLFSLTCRFGGLNLPNPTLICDHQFNSSQKISAPLADFICQQSEQFHIPSLQSIKAEIRQKKQQHLKSQYSDICSQLDPILQRTVELTSVKCSSLWLTALPIQEQGFHLNKQEFRDALCFRYNWQLQNVPSHCVCGTSYSINHCMICRHGGLTFIRFVI